MTDVSCRCTRERERVSVSNNGHMGTLRRTARSMSKSVPACGPNLQARLRVGARYARLAAGATAAASASQLPAPLVGEDGSDTEPRLSPLEVMGELVSDEGRSWAPKTGEPGTLLTP